MGCYGGCEILGILIETTLPVFGAIAIGYAVARLGLLSSTATDALNQFVYYIAFPALLFTFLARTPVDDILHREFLGAWTTSLGVTFVLTVALSWMFRLQGLAEAGIRGMNCTCSSTAFMGIPLLMIAFGEAAALPAVLATIVIVTIFINVAQIFVEVARHGAERLPTMLVNIAQALSRNPLMISVILGVAASAFWNLPGPVERLGDLLGSAAIPCSLIAIGIFLAGISMRADLKGITVSTAIKLIVHPLVTWALVQWVFDLPQVWATGAILLAALPPATTCFVIAKKNEVLVPETSGVIWWSTILSIIPVVLVLSLSGTLE